MSKLYFIDSENVGDLWVALLPTLEEGDDILVFYTARSPHMSYRNLIALKESEKKVTFIECYEGNNALDFQLCSEIGYYIHANPDIDYFIVSNDTGYDAVVKYWKKKNLSIRRIQGKACLNITNILGNKNADSPIKTNELVPEIAAPVVEEVLAIEKTPSIESISSVEESPAIEKASSVKEPSSVVEVSESEMVPVASDDAVQAAPSTESNSESAMRADVISFVLDEANKSTDDIDAHAKEVLFILGKNNLQLLHEALQQLYGQKVGSAYYNAFKTDTAYNSYIANHPKMSLSEKNRLYCSIVFELSAPDETMPADFPKFVVDSWKKKKNLNSFRSSLQSKYGKEKSERFYSLFKAHIKILDKIK